MSVSLSYLTSLVDAEIASGTPKDRIVFMGHSQGAGMVVLFLQTRLAAAGLGAIISYAGFPPTDLASVFRLQQGNSFEERKEQSTRLFLLQGEDDVFVPIEVSRAWLRQLEKLRENGRGVESMEWRLVEGANHSLTEPVWKHVRDILELVVPQKHEPDANL